MESLYYDRFLNTESYRLFWIYFVLALVVIIFGIQMLIDTSILLLCSWIFSVIVLVLACCSLTNQSWLVFVVYLLLSLLLVRALTPSFRDNRLAVGAVLLLAAAFLLLEEVNALTVLYFIAVALTLAISESCT